LENTYPLLNIRTWMTDYLGAPIVIINGDVPWLSESFSSADAQKPTVSLEIQRSISQRRGSQKVSEQSLAGVVAEDFGSAGDFPHFTLESFAVFNWLKRSCDEQKHQDRSPAEPLTFT
jgi:hypothetical protein